MAAVLVSRDIASGAVWDVSGFASPSSSAVVSSGFPSCVSIGGPGTSPRLCQNFGYRLLDTTTTPIITKTTIATSAK